ncbi:ThiF family adenylyltransferase [Actinoplanes sp. NPDC051475]|uniref:HesA/MoeB/ThiF family protein n=1 Tax=Actinoplanes sp. NPDC051475 TaxID=3157225 RepID=UPI00344E1766
MNDDSIRYDRNIMLFGADGQNRVKDALVGFAGLGGLGCHLVQHLSYLGVTRYVLVDGDRASSHSLNRLVTAYPDDVGQYKTDLAERMIRAIHPDAEVVNIRHHLPHPDATEALTGADLVLGGLDNDAPRLLLTDLASQHRIIYIDAATDTHADAGPLVYGGRVVVAGVGPGCLFCLDHLDQRQIRQAAMTDEERTADAAIYGVPAAALDDTGPSVVTINGVVASLAATEAMVHLTGLRVPQKQLTYRADVGGVRLNLDPPSLSTCPYCARWNNR